MVLSDRFRSAWNAFFGRAPTKRYYSYESYGSRPDKTRRRIQNERSLINSIYTRIMVDCSSVSIRHVRLDDDGNYKEDIKGHLNNILTSFANSDQTGRAFISDIVYSILDEGYVALVPTDTTSDPNVSDSYDVITARVGKIIAWKPFSILVEVYNENIGRTQQIWVEKRYTPIIENPFYAVMNESNSTFSRLIRVLNQLDQTNEQNSAGKMDLIIQVPYSTRSYARKKIAEDRRKSIEAQLTGSQYGIAYIDSSEHVIQLNRAAENNLWNQAKDLKEDLFNQMGLDMSILNGTADEKTLSNYYNRIIEPILTAITEAIEWKWISKTAKSQSQAIRFFRDPFKLIPTSQMATMADTLKNDEIMSANEIRSKLGMPPSSESGANELKNTNINPRREYTRKTTFNLDNEET